MNDINNNSDDSVSYPIIGRLFYNAIKSIAFIKDSVSQLLQADYSLMQSNQLLFIKVNSVSYADYSVMQSNQLLLIKVNSVSYDIIGRLFYNGVKSIAFY